MPPPNPTYCVTWEVMSPPFPRLRRRMGVMPPLRPYLRRMGVMPLPHPYLLHRMLVMPPPFPCLRRHIRLLPPPRINDCHIGWCFHPAPPTSKHEGCLHPLPSYIVTWGWCVYLAPFYVVTWIWSLHSAPAPSQPFFRRLTGGWCLSQFVSPKGMNVSCHASAQPSAHVVEWVVLW